MPTLNFSTNKIENIDNKITAATNPLVIVSDDGITSYGPTILDDTYGDDTYPSSKVVYDTIQSVVVEQIRNYIPAFADYIVEQNVGLTRGEWTYRKWDSGISECWIALDATSQTGSGTSTLSNNTSIPYSSREKNFPDGLFIEKPMVFVTGADNGGGVVGAEEDSRCSATLCHVCIYGPDDALKSTDTKNSEINVHAIGRWK